MSATGRRDDPFLGFRFLVEVAGVIEGAFTEVTGLQIELETQDYREGGENAFVHKLAGPVRYPSNLVLRRGLTRGPELWAWHLSAAAGLIVRAPVAVVLLDTAGDEAWRWTFKEAYPVRWTGPELRAESGAVAFESLELAHAGLLALGMPPLSGPAVGLQ